MTLKDYGEKAEIEFVTTVTVDGEHVAQVSAYSLESLIEDFGKLTHAVEIKLIDNYEDLPESKV